MIDNLYLSVSLPVCLTCLSHLYLYLLVSLIFICLSCLSYLSLYLSTAPVSACLSVSTCVSPISLTVFLTCIFPFCCAPFCLSASLPISPLVCLSTCLSHLQTWLRSYIKLFQSSCQRCGRYLQDGLPPTWRDFRTLEAFHDTCRM